MHIKKQHISLTYLPSHLHIPLSIYIYICVYYKVYISYEERKKERARNVSDDLLLNRKRVIKIYNPMVQWISVVLC